MILETKEAMNASNNLPNGQNIISNRSQLHHYYLFFVMMLMLGFIVSFNPPDAMSQNKEFTRSYFPGDSKGLREARKNLQQGDRLFMAGNGNYKQALEYYLKAHAFNPDNAQLNMMIGYCYIYTKDVDKSIEFLERAVILNVPTLEIYFLLGRAYQLNYRFEEAIDKFTFYRQSLTPQEAIQQRERIDRHIAQCKNGKGLVANPIRVFIDNPGNNINSEYDDYRPVLSPSGQIMYFTSRRPLGRNTQKDKEDQKYFEDVFVSRRVGDNWRPAEPVEGRINTKTHDAPAGISPDGNRLYVYRGDKGGEILESVFENNKWSRPKRLPKSLTTQDSRETNIVFTTDDRRVYFISDREGGFGGKDIWTSQRDERGRWGLPLNLGAVVNTEFDEESPYLATDNQTLYFSSQGHNSMGGFDIFNTVYRNGRWTRPQNIGYPVNTPGDDLFLVMASDQKTGYYSSVKKDGYGGSDIYTITFLGPEKPFIVRTQNELIANNARPLRPNLMEGEVEVITIPMTIIRGRVMDDKTNELLFAAIELYDIEADSLLAEFNTNRETGEYFISLPGGRNYGISVKAEGYLFHSENMNVTESTVTREIINDFRLKKLEVGETIVLNNIFFDTGAATLRPESYAELGILYKLMTDNPSMKIEISGHTDNVGSVAFNQRLSENRARAVVDFLIGRGIIADRFTFKGYGFDKPIATNETAEGRQLNRRTEFAITEK